MDGLAAPGAGSFVVTESPEGEDHHLLRRTAQGDQEALAALYARYATPVYSLARFMLGQPALAEEATQDIFLNIWLKASSYNPERGGPRSWIMSVAHHKVVDVIRSRRRMRSMTNPEGYEMLESLPSQQTPTDVEAELNLERERLRQALSVLPPAQQEAIILAYFEGYSHSEIAQKLEQPLGTIKTRVRLALQKLRTALEQQTVDG
ncbi:MAG TPA: sigma-70 family RNA polymerase sigma factor [Dehalococcoidia bacterium]|nr:sigma-70 family RNA polymerase sigma factor [Dehalococcoidia bacterium]